MDCEQVCERLSAYFDGELSSDACSEVECHIAGCSSCSTELDSFREVRRAILSIGDNSKTPDWAAMSAVLENNRNVVSSPSLDGRESVIVPLRTRTRWTAALAATAALLVLMFQLRPTEHASFPVVQATAINLQPVLESLGSDGAYSQASFSSKFPTYEVTSEKAEKLLGRRMVSHRLAETDQLPGRARLVSTELMKFSKCRCPAGKCTCGPGECSCVACVCQRSDGSHYLVLEHCRGQDVNFGDLVVVPMMVAGKEIRKAELNGALAVLWERNGTMISAVGMRDDEEIGSLLAYK
jgi:hypothetical protein